jgi:3',5'-cyclic AMP phosphodiesterase CpdA
MRHCLTYHGSFERNRPSLKPGATTFTGTDGASHPLPDVPEGVDGVRVGYMEKPGKKFVAVRVQHGSNDIVLENDTLLDPPTHMGYGKRFGPEPTIVDDDEIMARLLADVMAKNPGQRNELARVRSSFSVTGQRRA